MTRVTGATCGVAPRGQADGFFKEAELGVVQPEGLVDDVRRWLHVHLQDGHQLAVDFKCNLSKKGVRGWKRQRWREAPTLRAEPRADGICSRLLSTNCY